jgi:glyoxalase family protein
VDTAKNGVPVLNDIRPHGLHHVTAIASDPQRNEDFYTRVLGLRLVKQTVNFDARTLTTCTTYHLYYGNQQGHPSTLLTPVCPIPLPGRASRASGAGTSAYSRPDGSPVKGQAWPPS